MACGRVAALGDLPDLGLLAEIEAMEKHCTVGELLATGGGWQAVEDTADVRAAETTLLRSLGKAADGIISRNINRKISTAITRRLAPYRVSPNHVTSVVLLIGLASGPLAYLGSYLGLMLGAFCYYAAAVLDGVDGELARLKYQGSPFGTWYDTVVDDVVGLCFLVGLYAGLSRGVAHPYWTWLGIGTVTCYLATIVPRYYLLVTRVGDGNHQTLAAQTAAEPDGGFGRVMQVLKETVARTDFLPFYAFVAALCAAAPVFAASYAFGASIALVDTVITLMRVLRAPAPAGAS
jgi:phosphatidylglycerophosphate synthase